ncbi:hypothetical protein SAMN05192554_12159, partial [Haloarchaeobius iranensis]
ATPLPAGWLICISAASVSFRAIETACLTKRKRTFCTTVLSRFTSNVLTARPYAVRGFNRAVCDSIRNRRDWDFVIKRIECFLEIWMIIDAVFGLLAHDWYRTDSREASNYPQLIDVRKIREDSRVQDARIRWTITTGHFADDLSLPESSSSNSSSLAASTSYAASSSSTTPRRSSTPCSRRMSRIVHRSTSASLAASPSVIRSRS